jgi:isoamyl acetate esterase
LLLAAGLFGLSSLAAESQAAEASTERLVFMGDSITDGFTYPLLIQQALGEAGRPVPTCIDAGVASDTAALMRKRLDRDVLAHRPTRVSLSVGINDVIRSVPLADFEADVRAIADALKAAGVPLIVMTTSVLGPKLAEADGRLDDYNAVLRRVAKDHAAPLAEVNELSRRARADGQELLEPDQVHLSFEGYRVMARAVLDALGHADVAVPARQNLEPLPGIVPHWKVRPLADDKPLDESQAGSIAADDDWKDYVLPETKPQDHWWPEQERQRGFAMSVAEHAGAGKRYQALANVDAEAARTVYFNTGANLQTVWLNGRRIFQQSGYTGWHAGKERIAAELQPGKNALLIETTGEFFLSITDDNTW